MLDQKITALMPIKHDSQRVSKKNFRDFNGKPLFYHMMEKLDACSLIDEILINTDALEVVEYVGNSKSTKLKLIERPNHLLGDDINMNQLITYDITKTESEHFFQTHCTNPLLKLETIEKSIKKYFENLANHDTMFSVDVIQKRGFTSDFKPLNHNLDELIPTQDLSPILVENSNFFIFSRATFLKYNHRVGKTPYLYPVNKLESLDIDYEEEFLIAELVGQILAKQL